MNSSKFMPPKTLYIIVDENGSVYSFFGVLTDNMKDNSDNGIIQILKVNSSGDRMEVFTGNVTTDTWQVEDEYPEEAQ